MVPCHFKTTWYCLPMTLERPWMLPMSRVSGPPSLLINYILIFIILLPYTFVYAVASDLFLD